MEAQKKAILHLLEMGFSPEDITWKMAVPYYLVWLYKKDIELSKPLLFNKVVRFRPDKSIEQIDTLDKMQRNSSCSMNVKHLRPSVKSVEFDVALKTWDRNLDRELLVLTKLCSSLVFDAAHKLSL